VIVSPTKSQGPFSTAAIDSGGEQVELPTPSPPVAPALPVSTSQIPGHKSREESILAQCNSNTAEPTNTSVTRMEPTTYHCSPLASVCSPLPFSISTASENMPQNPTSSVEDESGGNMNLDSPFSEEHGIFGTQTHGAVTNSLAFPPHCCSHRSACSEMSSASSQSSEVVTSPHLLRYHNDPHVFENGSQIGNHNLTPFIGMLLYLP
jgi:hypothetical protein